MTARQDASMNVALNGVTVTSPTLAKALGVEVGTKVAWAVAFRRQS